MEWPAVAAAQLLKTLAPAELGSDPQPHRLLHLAQAHGLLQHLDRRAGGSPSCPRHVLHCLRLTAELLRVLELLERHGLQAVPVKGPVLAVQLYGDPTARAYQDVDLFVRSAESDRALALLLAHGYELQPEAQRVPAQRWRRWLDHCRLTRDGVTVELHWELDQRGLVRLGLDAAVSRLEPVQVGGRVVRTLSREQAALYLAVHGAKHAWARGGWILDFGQLVKSSPDLDWGRAAAEARARGAERSLLLALRLARDLVSVAPPESLALGVAADRRVATLADAVRARLCLASSSEQRYRVPLMLHLKVQERLCDRIRYLARILFVSGPADWAVLRLPAALSWLYVFIRPLRLGLELTTAPRR